MISLFKLKAILAMSAVFALGAIIGASWGGIVASRNATSAQLSPSGANQEWSSNSEPG